jgi:hypothetical protein
MVLRIIQAEQSALTPNSFNLEDFPFRRTRGHRRFAFL